MNSFVLIDTDILMSWLLPHCSYCAEDHNAGGLRTYERLLRRTDDDAEKMMQLWWNRRVRIIDLWKYVSLKYPFSCRCYCFCFSYYALWFSISYTRCEILSIIPSFKKVSFFSVLLSLEVHLNHLLTVLSHTLRCVKFFCTMRR